MCAAPRHPGFCIGLALVLLLTAAPSGAFASSPNGPGVNRYGQPARSPVVGLTLELGDTSGLLNTDFLNGDERAVMGWTFMVLGASINPALEDLLRGDWQSGLSRSAGRLTCLGLLGASYHQMSHGPAASEEAWAVIFNLTAAASIFLTIWDEITPLEKREGRRLGAGWQFSVSPLLLPPPPGTPADGPLSMGLSIGADF